MAAHPKPASTSHRTAPMPAAARSTEVAASHAKAHLLSLLDQVEHKGEPIIITKRGRPVARIVPIEEHGKQSFFDRVYGSMAGSIRITGDIVSPDWESWGPEWR